MLADLIALHLVVRSTIMSTKVFLLLLVAAIIICINAIGSFREETECQYFGGVCTYQKNCSKFDHFRVHCPEQGMRGAICCLKANFLGDLGEDPEEITNTEEEECYEKCRNLAPRLRMQLLEKLKK